MRAVINTGQGIQTVDIDEPTGPGVRIQFRTVGISGTDTGFAAMGVQGFTFGHEFAGVAEDGRYYFIEPEHGTLGVSATAAWSRPSSFPTTRFYRCRTPWTCETPA